MIGGSIRLPVIVMALCILCASSAYATSCAPLQDRYVFSCDTQRCTGEFRVDEVPGFGACGRRPVVKDIDPEVGAFLAPLISASTSGVYTIVLRDQYWRGGGDDGSLTPLLGRLKRELVGYEERASIDLRSLSPKELKQMMERELGGDWLKKDVAYSNAQEARRAWESKERREHAKIISLWVAYWASFAVFLVWLVHSIHVFFLHLYQTPTQGTRQFISPWFAQLIIGFVGAAAAFLVPVMVWPGVLLVPVVIVVLLAEGWAYYRRRHSRDADA